MTKAAIMENDTLHSDLATALDNVHVETNKLFAAAWMMRCMIDPMEQPASKNVSQVDVWYLLAELLEGRVSQIEEISREARLQLHGRMYPKASR